MNDRGPDDDLALPELPARFGSPPLPPPRLSEAIRAEVHADTRKPWLLGRTSRVVLSVFLFSAAVSTFALLKTGDGVHRLQHGAMLGAVGWGLVVVGMLLAGVGRFGAKARWVQLAITLSVPLSFLAYLALVSTSWVPLPTFLSDDAHTRGAFGCGSVSVGFGALATASVLLVWRKTDPFNPGWSGAVLGLIGGLGGATSVGLVCPWREGWHLWLGHGVCVLLLSLVGALIGRRLMTP